MKVFVENLGCDSNTASILMQFNIDGPQLLDLTPADLEAMGIKGDQVEKLALAIAFVKSS